jgi:rRNA maturation protein Nop10
MVCKGRCKNMLAPFIPGVVRYVRGNNIKRCTVCQVYTLQTTINCLCCGMMLRTRSRAKYSRQRYDRERVRIE